MGTIGEDNDDVTEEENLSDDDSFDQSPPDGHKPLLEISKHDDYDVSKSPSMRKSIKFFNRTSRQMSSL